MKKGIYRYSMTQLAIAGLLLFLLILGVPSILGYLLHDALSISDTTHNVFRSVIFFLSLSLIGLVFIVEFISPFLVKGSTFITAVIAFLSFVTLIVSPDAAGFVFANSEVSVDALYVYGNYANIAFGLLYGGFLIAFYFFFKHDFGGRFPKYVTRISFVIYLVAVLSYIPLSLARLTTLATLLLIVVAVFWLFTFSAYVYTARKWNVIFTSSIFIVAFFSANELLLSLTHDTKASVSAISITPILIILESLCFFTIYLYFSIFSSKGASERDKYFKELSEMQTSVLKNQISSHFLFNAMTLVKSQYHTSQESGDRALDLLSKFLRAYTEAGDHYLVPLSKELDVISAYSEFANLKGNRPFNIIYNIEEYDYSVPYFGLQPLLENAIRYSGVDEMEEGYIQIDSILDGDYYVLMFSDNGKGFDFDKLKNTSVGIRNVAKRFELLCHASFLVKSSPGKGTRFIIKIPREAQQE